VPDVAVADGAGTVVADGPGLGLHPPLGVGGAEVPDGNALPAGPTQPASTITASVAAPKKGREPVRGLPSSAPD
jgi:hypothetical protein